MDRVVDTLTLARKKHPGQPNSLDALCDRYAIDRSRRVRHGALLDAEMLVEVYCELMGGRQQSLLFGDPRAAEDSQAILIPARSEPRPPRRFWLEPEEAAVHARYVETFVTDAIWARYLAPPA
jgi:DNA polymerase-3 subunit epsilon